MSVPVTALALLLAAAVFHAGWNFLLKQLDDKHVTTWWALVVGTGCILPFLFIGDPFPLELLPYSIASGAFEAAYFTVLATAYGDGDFSLVYPIARGAAPALIALWAFLFLGERPHGLGIVGLVVLVVGLAIVGGGGWWARAARTPPRLKSIGLAFGVAACISAYSVIDGAAVRLINPLPYLAVTYSITTALVTPLVIGRFGWPTMRRVWQGRWPRLIAIALLSLAAYVLVLWAYGLAPVSYAGAIREISIVFGALAGWRWLGERLGRVRALGATVIFVGIFLIALAR
jgi:drug/metabolite transporter (DMT)-like permease